MSKSNMVRGNFIGKTGTKPVKKLSSKKLKELNTAKIVITKDSILGDVVYKYPKTIEVFMDFGLHCVGCPAAGSDTIEFGSKLHGLSDKDISDLVERINEVINFKE